MFDFITIGVVLLVIAAILIHRWKRPETGHCYVSDDGNDATALRGDPSRPFRTIRAAIDAAQPGDTVHVMSGGRVEIHATGGEKISQLRFDVTSGDGASETRFPETRPVQVGEPVSEEEVPRDEPVRELHYALDRETTARLALRLHEALSAACRYMPTDPQVESVLADVDNWHVVYMGLQVVEQQKNAFAALREQARRAREAFAIRADLTVSVAGLRLAKALFVDAIRALPLQRAKLNNDASISLLLGQGPGSFGETRPATYRVVLVGMSPAKGQRVPDRVPSSIQVTRADGSAETVQLLDALSPGDGLMAGRVLEKPVAVGPGDVLRVQVFAEEGTAPYRDFATAPITPAHVVLHGILDEMLGEDA